MVQAVGVGRYEATDLRSESREVRHTLRQHVQDSLMSTYPIELICESSVSRYREAVELEEADGDIARGRRSAFFDSIRKQRISTVERQADVEPLTLVLRRDRSFFGAFQLMGIRVLGQNQSGVRIAAIPAPYFPVRAPIGKITRLAAQFMLLMLDHNLPLADGRMLDVARWYGPRLWRGAWDAALSEFTEIAQADAVEVDGKESVEFTRTAVPEGSHGDPFEDA